MDNYCPLSFECVIENNCCANINTCYFWVTAWELPYSWDYKGLTVNFFEAYSHLQNDLSENPITSRYDWRKYFAEYGFAEAVNLPYYFRSHPRHPNYAMVVSVENDNTALCVTKRYSNSSEQNNF